MLSLADESKNLSKDLPPIEQQVNYDNMEMNTQANEQEDVSTSSTSNLESQPSEMNVSTVKFDKCTTVTSESANNQKNTITSQMTTENIDLGLIHHTDSFDQSITCISQEPPNNLFEDCSSSDEFIDELKNQFELDNLSDELDDANVPKIPVDPDKCKCIIRLFFKLKFMFGAFIDIVFFFFQIRYGKQ